MTDTQSIRFLGVAVAMLLVCSGVRAEPVLVNVEVTGALPLTEPQTALFNPGGSVAAGLLYPFHSMLLGGVRTRLGLLLDASSTSDDADRESWADRATGGFGALGAVLRFRPFGGGDDVRRGTGLFLEAAGGGALTGELIRPSFDAGLGWGFELGIVDIAPTVRFFQVIHNGDLDDRDGRLLLFGAELSFFDARMVVVKPPEPPKDRDRDGIPDLEDSCPDDPEDVDGFKDEDGCPDPDNDNDSIEDKVDKCPNDPEDFDDFQDDDGCPDPDNDNDGFLDPDDSCPNEPETVNGNKDYDGCPDEGLIELVNDRIVLEERVLFDLSRARIKRAAKPILRAIKELQAQHPEWISLRIEGHADIQGDPEFNQELSERRAANVRDELVKLGIPEKMIDAVGYGSTRLRDKRLDEEGHQRNRRVEFVVMARQQPLTADKKSEPGAEIGDGKETPDVNALQPADEKPTEEEVENTVETEVKEKGETAKDEEAKKISPEIGRSKAGSEKQAKDKTSGTKEEAK
ncbi:MAG: OmpA family protein [Deltaproteobacteria bacterium]|nr:OmpA family protein [Deltaproteobacteria bacterium]